MTPALQEVLRQAIASHRAGNFADAERFYKTVLGERPDQFDALLYFGVFETQRGRFEEAHRLICRAIDVNPQSPEAHSSLGNALHALERFEEALVSYDKALAIKPGYASALNSRGAALAALNRLPEAIASYDRALSIKPDYADALSNRGVALEALNRLDQAIASYDRALAINPQHVLALNNRGNSQQRLKRYEDALQSYDKALAINPHYVDALNNRGNALRALERPEEAIASYDQALAIRPEYAAALNHRAKALHALKRDEEALASCESALRIEPDLADAWINRGAALEALERHGDALGSYDKGLVIQPDSTQALNSRGEVLIRLTRYQDALDSYNKALAINPDYADALNGRGAALQALNRHDEALVSYEKALTIKPDFVHALYNRGNALQRLNRHQEALASYEKALAIDPTHPYARWMLVFEKMHCCEWTDREGDLRWVMCEAQAEEHIGGSAFVVLSISDSPQNQLSLANAYVRGHSPAARTALWGQERYAHDRIRLAYLSADFCEHPVGFAIAELIERHDRSKFDTIGISFQFAPNSDMQARLRRAFGTFIDVKDKSDVEVASLLRDREIDIAIDLNGLTDGARTGIFALRPTPIQVNYLGYPGTLGADYMDYILADRVVIPKEHYSHYSEQVVWLPDSYLPNDPTRCIAQSIPSRAQLGLPAKGFVFCAFTNSYKITPTVFAIWLRLLGRVEGSVLWLRESNRAAMNNLRREATLRGVAPERLVFAGHVELADHLARHRLADLFLDTLPYNAHTTASDALWAGLPVLTCLGTTFAGRVAGSLLNAIGLPELITHSLQEYEALAFKLATDGKTLSEIKQKLGRNRETFPLFDTDRFRRHIEAAYASMWERHQRGETPASFAVDPIDQ